MALDLNVRPKEVKRDSGQLFSRLYEHLKSE
jgi:hypothetical protein